MNFQLGYVQTTEEMRQNRLSLTMWTHLDWFLPLQISGAYWGPQQKLKFGLNDQTIINGLPQTVFKNALYFYEHKTPLLNTMLHINKDGRLQLHSKISVDIPCVHFFVCF